MVSGVELSDIGLGPLPFREDGRMADITLISQIDPHTCLPSATLTNFYLNIMRELHDLNYMKYNEEGMC